VLQHLKVIIISKERKGYKKMVRQYLTQILIEGISGSGTKKKAAQEKLKLKLKSI
jgi:large subunit ribosomal protein L21